MRHALARDAVKAGLLLAALSIDLVRWLAIWQSNGMGWDLSFMPKLFWALSAALFAAAYIKNDKIRIGFALLFAASTLFIHSTQLAIGVNVSYFDFVTIVDARSAFKDAAAQYGQSVIFAVIPAFMVFAAIAIRPRQVPRSIGWLAIVLPCFAIIGLSAILYSRNGKTGGLPAPFLGLGYAALYTIDFTAGNTGKRKPVQLLQTGQRPVRDLVLIIDESVSANYLDLTNPAGVHSALLEKNPNWTAANFGITAAITNCSMNTNVALRYGATRERYQQNIATGPSIWAYASKAGYKTVYLYGQRGGRNENYVSDSERAEIDEAIYFESIAPLNRDHVIAEKLANFLNNDVPELILINKYGVHFPLKGAVPGEQPDLLQEERFTTATLTKALENRGGWGQYRQHYRKALVWSVGGFFDRLSARLDDNTPPFTIIYTSDHGQTLHERGEPGINTHCTKAPQMEEGVVPLVVIENTVDPQTDWTAAAAKGRDGRSHYRIFPSLLKLMGYEPAKIAATYGPGLESAEPDPMTFGVEMHLRLATPPRWKRIDPACVILPGPGSDPVKVPSTCALRDTARGSRYGTSNGF